MQQKKLTAVRVCVCVLLSVLALWPAESFGQNVASPQVAPFDTAKIQELTSEVERLFASPLANERAWAAYLVAKYNLREFEPEVVKLLEPELPPYGGDEYYLRLVVLDSLIRMKMVIPGDRLAPLFKAYPAQTVILLSMDPKGNRPALLALLPESRETLPWLAIGNLLAETKAQGFAALVLQDLETQITVRVWDEPNHGGVVEGSGWMAVGDGGEGRPSTLGFPPIGRYELTHVAKRGALVQSMGKHPIYYYRVDPDGQGNLGGPTINQHFQVDMNPYRMDYLAELLDTRAEELPMRLEQSFNILWTGGESYRAEFVRIRAAVETQFDNLKARLVEKGALTSSESLDLKLKAIWRISDSRRNKTQPLPSLVELGIQNK